MQDVFLAFIKQPPFNCDEHIKAWIIRVTINKSKNHLKAVKKGTIFRFIQLKTV
ncbi:MAG: hypothetical protein LBU04_02920 [Christensenellaceae bacterium]|jgi:DNA-directed RNA polymerase specialized sigma24 family protein|nr:hypothetical protein [Christensenellaceae bacterium]